MTSRYNCPCCKNPLGFQELGQRLVELCCQYGKCESEACDLGAAGRTEAEAFIRLERNYEQELAKLEP